MKGNPRRGSIPNLGGAHVATVPIEADIRVAEEDAEEKDEEEDAEEKAEAACFSVLRLTG